MTRPALFIALALVGLLCALQPVVKDASAQPGAAPQTSTFGQLPRPENDSRELVMPPTQKMPFPIWGYDKETRMDRIFLAFPQEGAVFPTRSSVTFGWEPVREDVAAERYIVMVYNDSGEQTALQTGLTSGQPTIALFNPQRPGEYGWQVLAHLTNGSIIYSPMRRFRVMP